MSGCIWGAAAKRGLGGRLREGANVYNIYILIYTKRSQRDVLPRLGGPPVVGYRSWVAGSAQDTSAFEDTWRPGQLAGSHFMHSFL